MVLRPESLDRLQRPSPVHSGHRRMPEQFRRLASQVTARVNPLSPGKWYEKTGAVPNTKGTTREHQRAPRPQAAVAKGSRADGTTEAIRLGGRAGVAGLPIAKGAEWPDAARAVPQRLDASFRRKP